MISHYDILGVPADASQADIKLAYRKAAMRWHPDRNQDRQAEAEQRFKDINRAYRVLADPDSRRRYDEALRSGQSSASDRPGSAADEERAQEEAAQTFFGEMLDLAAELATQGYNEDVLTGALLGQGCPERLARRIAAQACRQSRGQRATTRRRGAWLQAVKQWGAVVARRLRAALVWSTVGGACLLLARSYWENPLAPRPAVTLPGPSAYASGSERAELSPPPLLAEQRVQTRSSGDEQAEPAPRQGVSEPGAHAPPSGDEPADDALAAKMAAEMAAVSRVIPQCVGLGQTFLLGQHDAETAVQRKGAAQALDLILNLHRALEGKLHDRTLSADEGFAAVDQARARLAQLLGSTPQDFYVVAYRCTVFMVAAYDKLLPALNTDVTPGEFLALFEALGTKLSIRQLDAQVRGNIRQRATRSLNAWEEAGRPSYLEMRDNL